MSQFVTIFLYSATAILAFLFSLSPLTYFLPQLLALLSIIFILLLFVNHKPYFIYLISLIINLIIFTTGGLSSPVFFLLYFLLFSIAFQNPPSTTLAFSLVLVSVLSQSLDSLQSLLTLLSLLFITPLAWFVGRQYLQNLRLASSLAIEETDILLWHSLKLKTGLVKIIISASVLLSSPHLNIDQKNQLKNIKDSAKSLLNSSVKLTQEIDKESDEI